MLCLGTVALTAAAQTKIDIKEYRYAGPFKVQQPVMMDSIVLSARKFGTDNLLDFPLNLDAVETGRVMHDTVLPNGENQLHLIGFTLQNSSYTTANISVKGKGQQRLAESVCGIAQRRHCGSVDERGRTTLLVGQCAAWMEVFQCEHFAQWQVRHRELQQHATRWTKREPHQTLESENQTSCRYAKWNPLDAS